MDVLCPDVIWIDNKCYRIPALNHQKYEKNVMNVSSDEWPLEESGVDGFVSEYGANELESMIQAVGENRFELQLPIAQLFWPQIIGAKGVTKKRIENDSKTKITIPKPMERSNLRIRGSTHKDIILASKYIFSVVFAARQKLTFTHFISIPINNDNIKTNFIKFKDNILEHFGNVRGIDESNFQKPEKLHLTLGTLVLADQRERKIAEDKLKEVYNQIIRPMVDNKKIEIEMRGIEYMNDDPHEVDVLYGKVNSLPDPMILQNLADEILNYFSCHNLIKMSERLNVKLHVTLMNTLFRDEELETLDIELEGTKVNKMKKSRTTFDATSILEKFQNYYFGHKKLESIELSVRYSTAKNGYYKSSSVVYL